MNQLDSKVNSTVLTQTSNKSQIWFLGAVITAITSTIAIMAEIIMKLIWR
jgi:hypothetical protein